MTATPLAILDRTLACVRADRRVALCAVVRSRGSTPQSAGALMLVDDAAELFGTVGGGCVEADVRRQAFEMLRDRRSGLLRFKLDGDYGWDDGLICGGTVEIAIAAPPETHELSSIVEAMHQRSATSLELRVDDDGVERRFIVELPAPERLLIAGAGHVGQALARLALALGFDVTLFDDRADLLERFAPVDCAVVSGDIAGSLRSERLDDRTFVVVVTRGHRHDEQALEAVLDRGARYVGMIGSRRKVKLIFDDLRARGARAQAMDRVHAPIGLPIGGVTVEEIALSIAAELVQVRRVGASAPVREIVPGQAFVGA